MDLRLIPLLHSRLSQHVPGSDVCRYSKLSAMLQQGDRRPLVVKMQSWAIFWHTVTATEGSVTPVPLLFERDPLVRDFGDSVLKWLVSCKYLEIIKIKKSDTGSFAAKLA